MRNDVEEAIEKHMLLNHEHPETVGTMDEAAALQELVELGVRIGIQAAAAIAMRRVETGRASGEGTVPVIGGADYFWVAQEIARIDPRRLVSDY